MMLCNGIKALNEAVYADQISLTPRSYTYVYLWHFKSLI